MDAIAWTERRISRLRDKPRRRVESERPSDSEDVRPCNIHYTDVGIARSAQTFGNVKLERLCAGENAASKWINLAITDELDTGTIHTTNEYIERQRST